MSECPKCDVDGDALIAVIDSNCEEIAKLEVSNKELLEALTKLLGNAIQLNDAGDGWTEITSDTQDVQQARAAIAKAHPWPSSGTLWVN